MVFFQVKIVLLLEWFVGVSGKAGAYSVPVVLEARLSPYILISMQHHSSVFSGKAAISSDMQDPEPET